MYFITHIRPHYIWCMLLCLCMLKPIHIPIQTVLEAAWCPQRVLPLHTKNSPEHMSTPRWRSSSAMLSSPSQSASSLTRPLSRWQPAPMTTQTVWHPAHPLSQASAASPPLHQNHRMPVGSWTWLCPKHTDLVSLKTGWCVLLTCHLQDFLKRKSAKIR